MKNLFLLLILLVLAGCKEKDCSKVQAQLSNMIKAYDNLTASYDTLQHEYSKLLANCDTSLIDTVFIPDTTNPYIDSLVVYISRPCFVCVKDSFYVSTLPNNDTLTMYITEVGDTIKVFEIDRAFWIVNYEFKDTLIRYDILYKDSTITIDSLRGGIIYLSTNCQEGENIEQCKARLALQVGRPDPVETITIFEVEGYSTLCNENYAIVDVLVNGEKGHIPGSGRIPLDHDGVWRSSIGLPIDSIKTITFSWEADCYEPDKIPPEDMNVFIREVRLNYTDYLTPEHAEHTGYVWWLDGEDNNITFGSNGSLIITP